MRRFLLTIACVSLLLQVSRAQVSATEKDVYSADFKWRFTVPDGFEPLSAEQFTQPQQSGEAADEKSKDGKIENQAKRICAFKNGSANHFEATQKSFDRATDGDYLAFYKAANELSYKTFKEQVPPGTKIDTTYSKETVDELQFNRFEMKVNLGGSIKLTMIMYTRLFGDKEFTASIAYMQQEMGDLILTAWRNSKFAKN